MRAALLEAEHRITLIDAPMPTITGADQVMVRVKAVGICGSEVHAFHGTHPYRKAPTILGHEVSGEVTAVGSAVTEFTVGDRVYVDPQWPCGECEYCRSGDINLCPSKKVLGTPIWPGAFGEYIVVPKESLFHLPSHLSYVQGCLVEPLTVGVHVVRRAGIKKGDAVAILGTGSIGSMVAGVCHAYGAWPVVVVDIHQHCLDIARRHLGATHSFLVPDADVANKIMGVTNGQGVDAVFVTADDVSLVNLAITVAKRRGTIVLVALLTSAPVAFSAYSVISRELHIIGSTMANNDDVQEALRLAATKAVDVEAIATHVLPIVEAQRGLELALSKQEGAIKVVLTFP